jgi:hypothetical protein
VFIGQSLHSDYCAVYATAMALSLVGHPTGRRQAMALFGARPGWPGASHAQISTALRRRMGRFDGRWRHVLGGDAQAAAARLRRCAAQAGAILVTAYCRHRTLDLVCGHAFVLTGRDRDGVWILDPLAGPPGDGARCNAQIPLDQSVGDRMLRVRGSAWDVCLDRPMSTMRVSRDPPGGSRGIHLAATGR